MKTKTILFFPLFSVFLCCISLMSCKDDDKDNGLTTPQKEKDDKAGTFWVKDISRNKSIEKETVESVYGGDTLLIKFQPKKQYEGLKFSISVNLFSLNDSLYIVKKDSIKHDNISLLATFNNDKYDLSANENRSVKVERIELKDNEAGSFTWENLTTGNTLKLTHTSTVTVPSPKTAAIYGGDTIRLSFEPKPTYKNYQFTISCDKLERIANDLYVVKSNLNDDDKTQENMNFTFKADYNKEDSESIINLSASEWTYASYKNTFAFDVPFGLEMSKDLLLFATPEVRYSDADGREIVKQLTLADFKITTYQEYEDAEGQGHVLYDNGQPKEGWKLVEEGELTPIFYFHSAFIKRNTSMEASVKYYRKESVELTVNNCDFERSFEYIDGSIHIPITITIGTGTVSDEVKLSRAKEYLEKMFSETDKISLAIDKTGKIAKK